MADERVSAHDEPPLERVARLSRRHRPVAASVLTLLLATIGGLSIGLWFVGAERDKAVQARGVAEAMHQSGLGSHERVRGGLGRLFNALLREPAIRAPEARGLRDGLATQAIELAAGLDLAVWANDETRLDVAGLNRQAAALDQLSRRLPRALQSADRALVIFRAQCRKMPDAGATRRELAETLTQRGKILMSMGRSAEAEEALSRAIAECEALVGQPTRTGSPLQRVMALSLGTRGHPRLDRDRVEEATRDAERALGTIDRRARPVGPATRPRCLDRLIVLHEGLGEVDVAEPLIRMRGEAEPTPPP